MCVWSYQSSVLPGRTEIGRISYPYPFAVLAYFGGPPAGVTLTGRGFFSPRGSRAGSQRNMLKRSSECFSNREGIRHRCRCNPPHKGGGAGLVVDGGRRAQPPETGSRRPSVNSSRGAGVDSATATDDNSSCAACRLKWIFGGRFGRDFLLWDLSHLLRSSTGGAFKLATHVR